MIIDVMCGGKAKDFATTGGVVSPSSQKKKLSCELTVMGSKLKHYGKKTTSY